MCVWSNTGPVAKMSDRKFKNNYFDRFSIVLARAKSFARIVFFFFVSFSPQLTSHARTFKFEKMFRLPVQNFFLLIFNNLTSDVCYSSNVFQNFSKFFFFPTPYLTLFNDRRNFQVFAPR